MSEREFEHYLTLLGSLLRLRPEQRAEIAEELQQHLDERLVDLQAEGMSRADAIQQALAEFGDAAGLAAQFSSVSQRRYRRWMMRAATASVTSAFMVLVMFVSFWPTGGRIQLAPPITAQDAKPSDPAAPAGAQDPNDPFANNGLTLNNTAHAGGAPLSREARNASTRLILENRNASLRLNGASISELCDRLSENIEYGCRLDENSLQESGIDIESSNLTWPHENSSLATMLEILLDELDLTYQIRDGILVITTKDVAEQELSLVIYQADTLFASVVVSQEYSALPVVRQLAALRQQGIGGGLGIGGGAMGGGLPLDADLDLLRQSIEKFVENHGPNDEQIRFSEVANLVMTQVDPDSWEENGGMATISCVGKKLVVRQTERTHRKIRKLLDDLGASHGE